MMLKAIQFYQLMNWNEKYLLQQLRMISNLSPQMIFKLFQEQPAQSVVFDQQTNNSISIYFKDYQSLYPKQLLTTTIIDLLFKILISQAKQKIHQLLSLIGQPSDRYVLTMDAFVVTIIMNQQSQVVLDSLKPLDIFSDQTKYLLIPLNSDNTHGFHWVFALLIKTPTRYRIIIFDSGYGNLGMQTGVELGRKLRSLHQRWTGTDVQIEVEKGQNSIKQSNGYDCGIYAVGFCEYALKEIIVELQQKQYIQLNRLSSDFKHLLREGEEARARYRTLVQKSLRYVEF